MKNIRVKDMALCAMFTALITIGAFISIPTPLIPVTLQSMFVTLAGMLLGSKLGGMSALMYMIIGLLGIPVFTQGGGISYIFKPTFGYITGFVIAAYVAGLIVEKEVFPSYKRLLASSFASLFVMYGIGILYCYFINRYYMGNDVLLSKILISGFLVVIPGDIVTNILACGLAKRLIPVLRRTSVWEKEA